MIHTVSEPYMRALLGTAAHFCEVVILKAKYFGGRLSAVSMDSDENESDREREIGSERERKRDDYCHSIRHSISVRRSAPEPSHGVGERPHSSPCQ